MRQIERLPIIAPNMGSGSIWGCARKPSLCGIPAQARKFRTRNLAPFAKSYYAIMPSLRFRRAITKNRGRDWPTEKGGNPLERQTRCAMRLGLGLFVLAGAFLFVGPNSTSATTTDWVLVCPPGGVGEPIFQDQNGNFIPIRDRGERAIAAKACNSTPLLGAGTAVNVSVTNSGANTIYVAFTNYATQQPGDIAWTNCPLVNSQAQITAGQTCAASVPATAGITRFCASTTQTPAGQSPNCNLAQTHNQTIVETNFGTGADKVCYPTSQSTCVWYDISVIPQNCTPEAWAQNHCQSTGGASYNLPVSLACANQPTYTCKGPPSAIPYGNANYPSNCGLPTCDNAYFWPTPVPEPNSECLAGQTLKINFLAGP
jgi:hypothetical protein